MMNDQDIKILRQLMWEIGEARREMAEDDFVQYRESLSDHTTFLRLKIMVPVCADCWVYEARMEPDIPHVMPDTWEMDLLLMGFPPTVIDQLKEEIEEGISEERGPLCHYCNRWLPWWEDDDGCHTETIEFADYFGFEDKESPAVSKALRKRIVKMYGRKCFACGQKLTTDEITVDHIVARSNAGTGEQINLQVLCQRCNNAKGNIQVQEREAVLHFPMRPVPSDAYEGVTW